MGQYLAGFAVGRTRDRKAATEFLAQEAQITRQRERQQNDAAQAVLEQNRKLLTARFEIERQIIERNGLLDDTWVLPQSAVLLPAGMSQEMMEKTNIAEAGKFVNSTPEYYSSSQNADTLVCYLGANNVRVANAECFKKAFHRLTELGMLETRPVVNLEPDGPPYTEEELNAMSADDYAEAVGLKRARPEEVRPAASGHVKTDEALAPVKVNGKEESAEEYRARLARSGISTRIPPRDPFR
jgi:hypothetical protein